MTTWMFDLLSQEKTFLALVLSLPILWGTKKFFLFQYMRKPLQRKPTGWALLYRMNQGLLLVMAGLACFSLVLTLLKFTTR